MPLPNDPIKGLRVYRDYGLGLGFRDSDESFSRFRRTPGNNIGEAFKTSGKCRAAYEPSASSLSPKPKGNAS